MTPGGGVPASPRTVRIAVGVAALASLGLHLVLAANVHSPFLFHDETGYIAVARLLVGEAPSLAGPAYFGGYGLLLSPFAAVLGPADLLVAAHVVNASAAAATLPILYALARRLGVSPWPAAAVAVVGAVTSRSLVQSGSLTPETIVVFALAASTLLLTRALATPRSPAQTRAAVAAGCVAGSTLVLHPRSIAVLGALWLVAGIAMRRRVFAPAAALGAVIASNVIGGLGVALARLAEDELYPIGAGASVSTDLGGDLTRLVALPVIAVGQLWYVLLASVGLAGLGLVAGARLAVSRRNEPDGLSATFIVLGFLAAVALASLASVGIPYREPPRADQPIYGRYLEQWVPLLIVLAPLLTRALVRVVLPAVVLAVLGSGLTTWWWYDAEVWSGAMAWQNVTVVFVPFRVFDPVDFVRLTTFVLAAVLALAFLVSLLRPVASTALLGVAAVSLAVASAVGLMTDWADTNSQIWAARQRLGPHLIEAGVPVAVDPDRVLELFYALNLQYWHPDVDVEYVPDLADAEPLPALVIGGRKPPTPGATRVGTETFGDVGIWATDEDVAEEVAGWPGAE